MPQDTYSLRQATPKDAGGVEALLAVSYPELMATAYEPPVIAPALKLITKANVSLLASGTYFVAESPDGAVVGCGGWTQEGQPGTDSVAGAPGHLRHFGTHPEWIRRGIGKAIYRRCEAGARSVGLAAFEVYSSLNGESFYSALGFERIRSIVAELRPGVPLPSVLMRRQI